MNKGKITIEMIDAAYNWARMMQMWNDHGRVCEQCGDPNLGPMLENDLWATIARRKSLVLCGPCIEGRLGRKVQVWDMNGSEWNVSRYAFMHIMYVLFKEQKDKRT